MASEPVVRRELLKRCGGTALALAATSLAAPVAVARTVSSGHDVRPPLAEDIARWLVELRYEDLPANVVTTAKRVTLDTLGCALGALDAEPVRAARRVIALQGGNPQATIVGVGGKAACDQAAFLNAMALRYLDYNDYIALGRPHHGSMNVAPALAMAEMQQASGKDFLLGLVAGYELEVRLRDAMAAREPEGWDGASIVAQYASAAAAGKLLRLDAAKLANALAIAGSNANTLSEVRRGAEMTPAKGAAEPMAVRNGVFAALLAREGLTYPLTMLDGEYGFGKMVPGALDESVLRKRNGEFQILKSCIKLWPCVGTAQAPIAAALEIYKQQPRPNEIERVVVDLSAFAYRQQIAYPNEIRTREHADHSIPYVVARALLDGKVIVDDFDEKRFRDPTAIALMKKIELRSDPALSDANLGARVRVTSRSGQTYNAGVPIPPGNIRNPADDTSVAKKFTTLAGSVLGRARSQQAIEAILSIDTMPQLEKLLSAVTRG
ncbi:MAG: MmgE/PrpD family protein [Alphaproteobacteria bacterium]|nr:MmgE/PrpD family protein [Alphaproteobacteria bacterium]